jgi:hypothetical protein
VPQYHAGDYVKVEFVDDSTGESEWMWVLVESSDDDARILFGRLDNDPVVSRKLKREQKLAISYDKVREHRPTEIEKN